MTVERGGSLAKTPKPSFVPFETAEKEGEEGEGTGMGYEDSRLAFEIAVSSRALLRY